MFTMDNLQKYIMENNKEREEIEETFKYNIKVYNGSDKLKAHKKLYHISEYELNKIEVLLS